MGRIWGERHPASGPFRCEDGTPVVGEARVAKPGGYDTTAFLALIQALAGAAQLATPNQLKRLSTSYPGSFGVLRCLDVAVVAYQPPQRAPARHQKDLDAVARAIGQSSSTTPSRTKFAVSTSLMPSGEPGSLKLRVSGALTD